MQARSSLAAVVILYRPDKKVWENIRSYEGMVRKIWVFDNTEGELADLHEQRSSIQAELVLVQDGRNKGIGARINEAIEQATTEGFEWLLTMDQDSAFVLDNAERFSKVIDGISAEDRIGIIGPEHGNSEKAAAGNVQLVDNIGLITSGSFVYLPAVASAGRLNEDLFIDEVDTDFACRMVKAGWRVVECRGVFMVHHIGETVAGRSLRSGKHTPRSIHAPVRLYYMTRNFLWVRKRYGKLFPDYFKKRSGQMLHIYKNNILYNNRRGDVLRMCWRGFRDYRRNRLGKYH